MALCFDDACAGIAEIVRAEMAEYGVPGVAVALRRGSDEHVAGFGFTNVEHPLPVDGDTLFQVGSTTKTVTALVAMTLADVGVVHLDRPVREVVPELRLASPEVTESVTLRHLLTHTAGFDGDLLDDFGPGDDALARYIGALADLPQITPLGEVWNYNNAGFSLAGRVIEVVTGSTFEQAVHDVVLEPLRMTRSCFFAADAITYAVAAGHVVSAGAAAVVRPWQLPRAINPAGGLISSARDQLAYARFHLGDGTTPDGIRVLSQDALVDMRRPHIAAGGGRAAFGGHGWLIQRTAGVVSHGGSTLGQESSFVVVPDHDFAVTVLTNADTGVHVQRAVTRWALRHVLDLERPPATPAAPSARTAGRYAGRYAARNGTIDVTTVGQVVTFTSTSSSPRANGGSSEAMAVEVYEDGGFRILSGRHAGQRGEFLDHGGQPAWLRVFGRVHARVAT